MEKTKEELTAEVEKRRDELTAEWGDDDFDIIQVNEILRDEFNDEKYKDILIDLEINDSDDDLGLETADIKETLNDLNDDDKKDNMLKTMLQNNKHIQNLALTLLGYDLTNSKPKYTGKSLIPKKDAKFLINLIAGLYQPQTLGGKLGKNIRDFDGHYNTMMQNFRIRLADYKDDVCSEEDMAIAIDIGLNEINNVRAAIINGRIGDLTRDVAISSYNEKEEIRNTDDRIEKVRNELKL